MHFYLLENPAAGRGRAGPFLEAVGRRLVARGHHVTTYRGGAPGDLARHAKTLEPGAFDRLVLAGGDGTLGTIVNARPDLPPWPIGLVPFGTANLVARETGFLGLTSPDRAAEALVEGRPWPVDVMDVRSPDGSSRRAVAVVSAGLDAAVAEAVADVRRAAPGSGGYGVWLRPMSRTWARWTWPRIEVRVAGQAPVTGTLVLVQNARSYAGPARVSPDARLDSGRLEIVVATPSTRRDTARLAVRAALRRAHTDRQVRILRGASVSLHATTPVPVQIDGDPEGTTDREIGLASGALTLLRRDARTTPTA